MKLRKRVLLLTISGLSACSYPYGYHDPAPDTCDGAPGCAVSAIYSGVIKTKRRFSLTVLGGTDKTLPSLSSDRFAMPLVAVKTYICFCVLSICAPSTII